MIYGAKIALLFLTSPAAYAAKNNITFVTSAASCIELFNPKRDEAIPVLPPEEIEVYRQVDQSYRASHSKKPDKSPPSQSPPPHRTHFAASGGFAMPSGPFADIAGRARMRELAVRDKISDSGQPNAASPSHSAEEKAVAPGAPDDKWRANLWRRNPKDPDIQNWMKDQTKKF